MVYYKANDIGNKKHSIHGGCLYAGSLFIYIKNKTLLILSKTGCWENGMQYFGYVSGDIHFHLNNLHASSKQD